MSEMFWGKLVPLERKQTPSNNDTLTCSRILTCSRALVKVRIEDFRNPQNAIEPVKMVDVGKIEV